MSSSSHALRFGPSTIIDITPIPNLVSCSNFTFHWSGGVPPYQLSIWNDQPNEGPGALPCDDYGCTLTNSSIIHLSNVTASNVTLKITYKADDFVYFSVQDSNSKFNSTNGTRVSSGNTDKPCVPTFIPGLPANTTGFKTTGTQPPDWSNDSQITIADSCSATNISWIDGVPPFLLTIQTITQAPFIQYLLPHTISSSALVDIPFSHGKQLQMSIQSSDGQSTGIRPPLTVTNKGNTDCVFYADASLSTSPNQLAQPAQPAKSLLKTIVIVIPIIAAVILCLVVFFIYHEGRKRKRRPMMDLQGNGSEDEEIILYDHNRIDSYPMSNTRVVQPFRIQKQERKEAIAPEVENPLSSDHDASQTRKSIQEPQASVATAGAPFLTGVTSETQVESATNNDRTGELTGRIGRAIYHEDAGPVEEFPPSYDKLKQMRVE